MQWWREVPVGNPGTLLNPTCNSVVRSYRKYDRRNVKKKKNKETQLPEMVKVKIFQRPLKLFKTKVKKPHKNTMEGVGKEKGYAGARDRGHLCFYVRLLVFDSVTGHNPILRHQRHLGSIHTVGGCGLWDVPHSQWDDGLVVRGHGVFCRDFQQKRTSNRECLVQRLGSRVKVLEVSKTT